MGCRSPSVRVQQGGFGLGLTLLVDEVTFITVFFSFVGGDESREDGRELREVGGHGYVVRYYMGTWYSCLWLCALR